MGGACGDLIAGLIDPTATKFYNKTVMHPEDRRRLKKPHTFLNIEEKDKYLQFVANKYKSIPSHDLDFHIERQHDIIGVIVEDKKHALWAANRFKNLHSQEVWNSMSASCGAASIDDYAQMLIDNGSFVKTLTAKIITVEEILQAKALEKLNEYGIFLETSNMYQNWLDLQKNQFII